MRIHQPTSDTTLELSQLVARDKTNNIRHIHKVQSSCNKNNNNNNAKIHATKTIQRILLLLQQQQQCQDSCNKNKAKTPPPPPPPPTTTMPRLLQQKQCKDSSSSSSNNNNNAKTPAKATRQTYKHTEEELYKIAQKLSSTCHYEQQRVLQTIGATLPDVCKHETHPGNNAESFC